MRPEARKTVLVADDSIANLKFIAEALKGEARVLVAKNGKEALERLGGPVLPDLALLDILMPGMDGFEVCRLMKDSPRLKAMPVIFLTGMESPEEEARGFALGAVDFIKKPASAASIRGRVRLQLELQKDRSLLEEIVARRTKELVETQREIVDRLALAAEYRDSDTGSHIQRIMGYSRLLARAGGFSEKAQDLMYFASSMHDVGKIGIPDALLLKTGKLEPAEFEVMKKHTTIGGTILEGGSSELLRAARRIALSHHEKWDGSGYPQGLAGEAIPYEARVVAVCDVFDALLSRRSYKKAWEVPEAVEEIRSQAGRHFDPAIARLFQASLPELLRVRESFGY